jgi:hypothetical protein
MTAWQTWCIENDFRAPSRVIWKPFIDKASNDLECPPEPVQTRNRHKKIAYYARDAVSAVVTRYATYHAFCRVIKISPKSFHLLWRNANAKGLPLHGYWLWKEHETPPPIVKPVKKPVTLRHGIDVHRFHSQTEAEEDFSFPRGSISRIIKLGNEKLPNGWVILKEEH